MTAHRHTKTRSRIILTDDHPMLVEGLKTMLGRRFDVVGVAHSGQQLLDLLKTQDADCLLLDLGLPDRNGRDLIPDIRALRPPACSPCLHPNSGRHSTAPLPALHEANPSSRPAAPPRSPGCRR